MATIGNTFFDLINLFKSQDQNRQIATVIELLKQTNSILDDAIAVECNNGTKHRTTIRTGLPDVTWGQLYKGVPQSKSTRAQVDDTTGFVEALSTIDKRLLDVSTNEGAIRLSEAQAFLEAMNQEAASKIIYGNVATDPEQFTGLAPRFNDTSAPNGGQIVDGGGTGSDNTSIWFVTWGDNQTTLLYPQGTAAGVSREDKGEQRVLDSDGNAYYVKEEMFRWHLGVSVRDWRFMARIVNIDVNDLAAGSVDLYPLMRKAFWRLRAHRVQGGRMAIYANSDVLEALDAQSTPTSSTTGSSSGTGTNVRLTPTNVDGQEVMGYRSIPVRQVDAIVNNEAQVT